MKKDIAYPLEEEKSSSNAIEERLNFLWRLFATGLGFLLFGCGGVLLCLTIFPIIILFTQNKARRSNRVRAVICSAFRFYLSTLEFFGLMNIKTAGLEHLENLKGKLIICNHPSLLDVVIIMSHIKNVQCIVNSKLWSNPFVGLVVRSAGYIRNDIPPHSFLEECKQILADGENILIFPEGTRSVPGRKMKMFRGFANLALFAEADIQALTLNCNPSWLIKGAKWSDIPVRKVNILLKAGPLFSYKNDQSFQGGSEREQLRSIRVRALMRDIQHYYQGNLNVCIN